MSRRRPLSTGECADATAGHVPINAVAKTGVTIDSVFQAAPINNKLPH